MQEYLETEVKIFVQKAKQLHIELAEVVKLIEEKFKEGTSEDAYPTEVQDEKNK